MRPRDKVTLLTALAPPFHGAGCWQTVVPPLALGRYNLNSPLKPQRPLCQRRHLHRRYFRRRYHFCRRRRRRSAGM